MLVPDADSDQVYGVFLASGRDEAAFAVGHGPGERAGGDSGHGGEVALGHSDRVVDRAGVGRDRLEIMIAMLAPVPPQDPAANGPGLRRAAPAHIHAQFHPLDPRARRRDEGRSGLLRGDRRSRRPDGRRLGPGVRRQTGETPQCALARHHALNGSEQPGHIRVGDLAVRPERPPPPPPPRSGPVWPRRSNRLAPLRAAARATVSALTVRSARTRPCSFSGRRTVSRAPAPGRSRPSRTPPAWRPRPRRSPPPRHLCPLPRSGSSPGRPQPASSRPRTGSCRRRTACRRGCCRALRQKVRFQASILPVSEAALSLTRRFQVPFATSEEAFTV